MRRKEAARWGRKRGQGGRPGSEGGFIVFVVMVLILTLTILALAANRNIITDIVIAENQTGSARAFYAAEAGATAGWNQLYVNAYNSLNPSTPPANTPAVNGCTWGVNRVPNGAATLIQQSATGPYAGLNAYVQMYRITSVGTDNATGATSTVTVDVEDQLIPIFQFGVFYNGILETFPGAPMTFSGWVHSNSSIYLGSNGSTLQMNSKVTTAANIFDYRLDSQAAVNPANIYKVGAPTQVNNTDYPPENHDSVTDTNGHGEPDWVYYNYASAWAGGVRTQYEGITSLAVPGVASNPLALIGTGTGSMYQEAGLKIIDGYAYNAAGTAINWCTANPNYKNSSHQLIIDPGCNSTNNQNPVVTAGTVYDYRQGTTMNTLDINVANLANYAPAMAALLSPPAGADPGILYVSSSSANGAVRLVNGAELPQNQVNGQAVGLTVATPNPTYVMGNYNNQAGNTTNTVPASIVSDAVTVLSNAWGNSSNNWGNGIYGPNTGINSRDASQTWVNTAIMTGNTNTVGSQYSGGLENFVRFLENWSNVNYNYSGSLVCLWQSQKATAPWPNTGTVYNPPNRNWSFGMNASSMPPGTPKVIQIYPVAWSVN